MIINAGVRSAETVRRARRGALLSEALTEPGTGRPVDLDGGQKLQVLDTLIASIGGAYAHLPAKRTAYASDPVQALTYFGGRQPTCPTPSSIGR